MNVQRHERMARIKKLSRYLYLSLNGIHYFFGVLWPLTVMWLLIGSEGKITLLNRSIYPGSLSFLECLMFALPLSLFFFLLLKVTHHFRHLILHFSNGDIFNGRAIIHAKKALLYALVIYGIFLLGSLVMWTYAFIKNQTFQLVLNGEYIFGIIIFCLMYVLLWALEIGCDLNEESELTI